MINQMDKTKIFVSHSWHDKFETRNLVDTLRTLPFVDVWVDSEQLQPGAVIQTEIDAKLSEIDLVVLMWSASAIASAGVKAEVMTCQKHQKRLVICKLDDTGLPGGYLPTMKSISFVGDFDAGVMRLMGSLINAAPAEWKAVIPPEILEQWNEYGGLYEETNHFAYKRKPSDDKKNLVADTYEQKLNDKKVKIEAGLADLKNVETYFAGIIQRMETSLHDTKALKAILQEVQQSPHAQTHMGQMLTAQIAKVVDSDMSQVQSLAAEPAPSTEATIPPQYVQSVQQFRTKINEKKDATYLFCKSTIGLFMSTAAFDSKFSSFLYFFNSAADLVENMLESYYLQGNTHPVLKQTIERLCQYLDDENAGLPDSQGGLIGLIDDSYIIHKSIPNLRSKGAMVEADIRVDTGQVQTAITIAELLVGAALLAALNETVQAINQPVSQQNYSAHDTSDEARWERVRQGRADIRKAQLLSLGSF
jgi:TIR domain